MKASIETKLKRDNKGFTLVELIIVIAIMALLAASIAPSVIRYIEKARKTKVLHEARIVYDQCQRSIGEFDSVEFKGQIVTLQAGMNKTDPVYGNCGRISNWSCYNELGAKNLANVQTVNAYVDQYIARGIVDTLPAFSKNDYAQTSPNGQTMSNIAADSRFSGKFNFICCYNSDGCLYVEVLHDGYFVHFDGNQTIEDVYSASRNPNMAFSNVN